MTVLADRTFSFVVLRGPAGSGKTELLHALQALGEQVLDLEGLACHRGSVFGGLGQAPQPEQERFEADLYLCLEKMDGDKRVWVEEETENLGHLGIPLLLLQKIRNAPKVLLQTPLEQRVRRLQAAYQHLDPVLLKSAVLKLRHRLDQPRMNSILAALENQDVRTAIQDLLPYYDQAYQHQFSACIVAWELNLEHTSMAQAAQELVANNHL